MQREPARSGPRIRNAQAFGPVHRATKPAQGASRSLTFVACVLVLIPFPFLFYQTSLTLRSFEVLWGAAWALSGAAALGGIWWQRPVDQGGAQFRRTPAGLRLLLPALCFLTVGFALFAGAVAILDSCDPACTGGGGIINDSAPASAPCGQQCGSTAGSSAPIGPVQIIEASFIFDAIGVALFMLAIRAAWRESTRRARPVSATGDGDSG